MQASIALLVTLVLASTSPRPVVVYLVSATSDSTAEIPEEAFPDPRLPPHRWQWRVFDPATRRDSLLLELPSFPTRARWTPGFGVLEYVVAGRIERLPWRFGARPVERIPLPADTGLCDFWRDPRDRRWHAITQRQIETRPASGSVDYLQVATRWDQEPGGAWRATVMDSGGDSNSDVTPWSRLRGRQPFPAPLRLEMLLDSMRVGHHQTSTLRAVSPEEGTSADTWEYMRSDSDPQVGLEFRVGMGDTPHAFEPVLWVDRRRGTRSTFYGRGDSQEVTPGQVAFRQRGAYLLVAAEYSGGHPAVVDMRTGEVLFRVDRPSARAVWAAAPR